MPQIWTFKLSLPQKPCSLGSGRWQTCLCCVGEFSKNLRQYHFRCFFQRRVITKFPNNYQISHHHIIWSLPRNEAFHSGTVGLRTLQRVIYPNITTEVRGLDDNGEDFFSTYFAMKHMRKSSWWLCHKSQMKIKLFDIQGPLWTGIKDFARLCSYNYRHVVWGVPKPPCVLQHFSSRDSKEGMRRSLFPRKLNHSHSNSATMRQELHVDSMDFLSFLGNCAIKPANFIYRCLDFWVCLIYKKRSHQQTSKTNVYDECHTSLGFFRGISPEVLGWHEGNTISTFFESEGQWYIVYGQFLWLTCWGKLPGCVSTAILAISGMWSARCASSCRIMRWGRGYFMFFSPDGSPKANRGFSEDSADPDLGTRFFFMFHVFKLSFNMKLRWNIIFPLH